MRTLFEHLKSYAALGRSSFAMPGHKGGKGLFEDLRREVCSIDVTELADTENLHSPGSIIAAAQQELSRIYQSKQSYFLTGGSTEGVHIMLHAACPGGKLIVNRSAHRSVINCCVLADITPVFIPQEIDPDLLIPKCVTPDSVKECIIKNPDADAVLITSPNYYGMLADIKGIAKVCHAHNLPLLVDEAHGAHFAAAGMPRGAIPSGADMAVQSAHKTLNALNQAALLHLSGNIIDPARVAALTSMVGTTSPSYPIVASAQLAVGELSLGSWRRLGEYIDTKKQEILSRTKLVMPHGETDPTRVVFGFLKYDITGYRVEEILRKEHNIDIEMSDTHNIVCIITPSNTRTEIDALFAAVLKICEQAVPSDGFHIPQPPIPTACVTPRTAFYSDGEAVPFFKASGRISKTAIAAYPPGIALICYGERIDDEMIEYIKNLIKSGASVEGLEPDGSVHVMTENL